MKELKNALPIDRSENDMLIDCDQSKINEHETEENEKNDQELDFHFSRGTPNTR